ncbi:MAG: DedA family protein [Terriglobales bacterium]|jgi:membrane protein DedA with SNARE-associated domain
MHLTIHSLRAFIAGYGYWAVALVLLSESVGIPVPGEITLLLASFLAYSEHQLHLPWIIVVATCAATLGGDLGYAVGHYGGRPLLDRYQSALRIPPALLKRGEEMFARYGAAAIFFARFIFGMRVFAGPLAGVLRMRWRAFAIYNFLGAAVWVTFIASVGYLFGQHWHTLLRTMQRFNIAVLIVAGVAILYLWWRCRRQPTPKNN